MIEQTWSADQIADGIYDTLAEARNFVKLTAIRSEWNGAGVSRDQVDQALLSLRVDRRIDLIAESNQKMLTDADWDAALLTGGEYRHLAYIPRLVF